MKNLKFQIHLLLFLLGVVIHGIIGQTPAGTIYIDGKEVEIFYKIKGSTPVTLPPVVVATPVPIESTGAVISGSRYDLIRGFVISLKINNQTPSEVSWDGTTFYPFSVIYQNKNNITPYWLKVGGKVTKVLVKTGNEASNPSIEGNTDNGQVDVPPIIETENNQVESTPVILPNNQTPTYEGFAEIGKTYEVGDKFKLHASSVETTNMAQHYWIKRDGKTIFELNSTDGWSPAEIYFGNHPIETIFPISDGNYDFYFKNTTSSNKNVIVGVIGNSPGDAYTQYMKGGLAKTMKWQLLKPGESTQFTLYLEDKCKKDSPLGEYKIQVPVYENGQLCLNKILSGKGYYNDNGVQKYYENGIGNESITFNSTKTIKMFKKTDESKNIVFKVQVGDQYGKGSITVLEKNGLDLMPDQVLISPWNISYYKIFNNRSDGYEDSPDYKAY